MKVVEHSIDPDGSLGPDLVVTLEREDGKRVKILIPTGHPNGPGREDWVWDDTKDGELNPIGLNLVFNGHYT